MFKPGKDVKGGCNIEFQFCSNITPSKDGKPDTENLDFWRDDSLVTDYDNFTAFYLKYKDIFNCAMLANGDTGFDGCGVNYYDAVKTKNILKALKDINENEYKILIYWLEEAVKKEKGFYILGV